MRKKNVVILGSTGSIGVNTLKVIESFQSQFRVFGLTARNNVDLLIEQTRRFKPSYIAIGDSEYPSLRKRLSSKTTTIFSQQQLSTLVSLKEVDIVVVAMSGGAALEPFLAAVRAGKIVLPANKEALVIAGKLIMAEAKKNGAKIIPIDSEQSAIFQCLQGQRLDELKKVILTASGGPLKDVPLSRFHRLSVKDILNHPRWKMGNKITVDSATLMNKGFEVIEAQRLFSLKSEQIQVVIHAEAIIHSMVEFVDGSLLAQLAYPDMRLPIQYALTFPNRFQSKVEGIDFAALKQMTFERPDLKKFPALDLCFHVANKDGTLPAVLNAADEVAVDAFLSGKIKFLNIYKVIEKVVLTHKMIPQPSLNDILNADCWAREKAIEMIGS